MEFHKLRPYQVPSTPRAERAASTGKFPGRRVARHLLADPLNILPKTGAVGFGAVALLATSGDQIVDALKHHASGRAELAQAHRYTREFHSINSIEWNCTQQCGSKHRKKAEGSGHFYSRTETLDGSPPKERRGLMPNHLQMHLNESSVLMQARVWLVSGRCLGSIPCPRLASRSGDPKIGG